MSRLEDIKNPSQRYINSCNSYENFIDGFRGKFYKK